MAEARWAVARWLHARGLPYSWITPRLTAQDIDAIKARAHDRAEWAKRNFH